LESAGSPAGPVSLEVTDDPCWVLLSSTGLLARTTTADPLPTEGPRARHDVVTHAVAATARGHVGVITSSGRMLRLSVVDLPALPITATRPALAGGGPVSEFCQLEKAERVVGLASLDPDGPVLALGTAGGVVKRLKYDVPTNKDDWEAIALKSGDEVVGAVPIAVDSAAELVFLTDDAQLLRFAANVVSTQGRSAAGMAGIRLSPGAKVLWFGAVESERDAVVVTVSGSPGARGGSIKVTAFAEYPGKGRGTGGVRCHRLGRDEAILTFGWVGASPARGAGPSGEPIALPAADGRRDGSGARIEKVPAAAAGPLS
jgi:DNA gyrase subunit A